MPISTGPLNVVDILRSIPDSVLTIDRNKRIVALNGPAEALTGIEEARAVGHPCRAILNSEICDTERCPFERTIAQGETSTNFNVAMRDASGTETPICINTSPLKNADGEVVGVVETIRNVSHINHLMEELRAQRNTVQAILDSLAEGVFTVDRDGKITSVNRRAEQILGCTADELVGHRADRVLPPELSGPAAPLAATLKDGRHVRNREVVVPGRGGDLLALSLSTGPFRTEAGTTLGAVCTLRDLREIERIADERRSRTPFSAIIGKHRTIREVFDLMEMIKDSDSTVLLRGESGTGKGLFAQTLHAISPRHAQAFVKVSCAALPETLLESELFGHEKGSFTGAIRERKGRFELADGGTIFLDEIGDLSPSVQVKLLRVLQEQEFERVGSNQTIRTDARIIAATHRDLTRLMREGRFREDLYYRLNVIPIHLPPLRDRKSDIPLLVEFLLERFAAKGKGAARTLSPRVMALLMEHDWPGNIRELENVLEHAIVCCRGGVIDLDSLPRSLAVERVAPEAERARPERERARRPRTAAPRETVLRALRAAGWNRSRAAVILDVDRTTLWRKMRRLGISPGK